MTSLPAESVKKVVPVHPSHLPHVKEHHLLDALHKLVKETDVTHPEGKHNVSETIHTPNHTVASHPWLGKYIPGLETLAADHHVGNFVIDRKTGKKFFESMPIYARIGMHLLFYGRLEEHLLRNNIVEAQLREQSIKEGIVYDTPASASSILSFIDTYKLNTDELLIQDIPGGYKCFNEFFYRKLKPEARPVENADIPGSFCSSADCRLTVYETVEYAREFWIKGKHFNIPNLLTSREHPEDKNISDALASGGANLLSKIKGKNIPDVSEFDNASLAIFRLAPADYHRFHSPADVIVGDVVDFEGQYYTVNPQAVNEPGFDVFTVNKRSVLYLTHLQSKRPIAFVAIGALLVGSITFTVTKGNVVKKGEELGYFAYGGSTVVCVFPPGLLTFDADLVDNSKKSLETLVRVGSSLGRMNAA